MTVLKAVKGLALAIARHIGASASKGAALCRTRITLAADCLISEGGRRTATVAGLTARVKEGRTSRPGPVPRYTAGSRISRRLFRRGRRSLSRRQARRPATACRKGCAAILDFCKAAVGVGGERLRRLRGDRVLVGV